MFTWGDGRHYQLGHGKSEIVRTPTLVQLDHHQTNSLNSSSQFQSVSCGWRHTLAIDIDNHVWSWGCNRKGQCGIISNDINIQIPSMVQTPTYVNILQVAAGWQFSLFNTG